MKFYPSMRFKRFILDVYVHTPFTQMVILLVVLWVLFSIGLYLAERNAPATAITSYAEALYWGVAAFSTAGIADSPATGLAQLIGGIWIVIGSVLFFGTIVATVTTYFTRPLQRPHRRIIDTIEYNLEQLNSLSVEELDLLKDTVDSLITNVEELKEKQTRL
ncbi:MAG: two pore domain potassium channel family protein [Pseudomonadales bacterium]|nr:two pore domain potassium channel family protein [Pseudomonadales bacterium]